MEKVFITIVLAAAILLGVSGCCRCAEPTTPGAHLPPVEVARWCTQDRFAYGPDKATAECFGRYEAGRCATDRECSVFYGKEY